MKTTPFSLYNKNNQEIAVRLPQGAYRIVIEQGLKAKIPHILRKEFPGARFFIITDSHLEKLHLGGLLHDFAKASLCAKAFMLPAGEKTKCFASLEALVEQLLQSEIERQDVVVALGGGVIGDLAGFAASIAKRGVPFVQIPTTLLAQIDSSIGGKTGINSAYGKNMIGSFYQPALVLIDPAFLDTLPEREMRSGYAEMVKYALINQEDFFSWLEERADTLFSNKQDLQKAIAICCATKAAIVMEDEKEKGARALLNFGHSFGHALERFNAYQTELLLHGEAIALGMVWAYAFSYQQGLCSAKDCARVVGHFKKMRLPTSLADFSTAHPNAKALFQAMLHDKKKAYGALTLILTKGIGRAFIEKNIDPQILLGFLEKKTS